MPTKDRLVQRIDPWVDQRTGDLIALRRSFHEQPELAFQEQATAERVQALTSGSGVDVILAYDGFEYEVPRAPRALNRAARERLSETRPNAR